MCVCVNIYIYIYIYVCGWVLWSCNFSPKICGPALPQLRCTCVCVWMRGCVGLCVCTCVCGRCVLLGCSSRTAGKGYGHEGHGDNSDAGGDSGSSCSSCGGD